MLNEDAVENEASLIRVRRVCRFISITLKTIFAIISIWWIAASFLMCLSMAGVGSFGGSDASLIGLILFLTYGAVIAIVFVTVIKIFSETAAGRSPFVLIQVRRLRIIAAMLLVYSLIDFVVSYNASFVHFDWSISGFVTVGESPFLTLNIAPLVIAAVVYAFSFVFKYGVLLQEFSDETL